MLVQKRHVLEDSSSSGSLIMIKIKVSYDHGSFSHYVTLPAQSTFGNLKGVLENQTGLEPNAQRLLFRGKERDDEEYLHMVGVTVMLKVILLKDPASRERRLHEVKKNRVTPKACDAISQVRANVDKLSHKVYGLKSSVHKVADSKFVLLTELLMMQLLKLDAIEAEGEAKVQRCIEVRRVQSFLETLTYLKLRNSFRNVLATPLQSSIRVNQDWEFFD